MKRMLLAAIPLLLVAACGSGGTAKDEGCSTFLGDAESAFNNAQSGERNGTVTDADFASAMGTVSDKLHKLDLINEQTDIKAKASDGSLAAGRLRVSVVPADVNTLRSDINALDAACVAAGK